MKTFKTIQKHYATLGICSSSLLNERLLFGFLLFGCSIILQFVYIFHVANGFTEYMKCFSSMSACMVIFVEFIAIVLRKTTLFKCIENIEKLIDTRSEDSDLMAFILRTSQQVERLSEIIFMVFVKIALHCFMLPECIISFGIYFMTDSCNYSFRLPSQMWFPFDWDNNPFGYLVAFFLEYIFIGYEFYTVACTTAFGIGGYWFAISAIKLIQGQLQSINAKIQANGIRSNEFIALFSKFIDTHGIVKQVEHDFSDIFQPIIMLVFTWSLLAISSALLIIQMEFLYHESITPLWMLISNGASAFAWVFISCEIGQKMVDAFDGISITIEQFNWYLFPIQIQRMLPMVIANAQQPVKLECFGSITCIREVFRKVINRAFSYFMMLRQIGD